MTKILLCNYKTFSQKLRHKTDRTLTQELIVNDILTDCPIYRLCREEKENIHTRLTVVAVIVSYNLRPYVTAFYNGDTTCVSLCVYKSVRSLDRATKVRQHVEQHLSDAFDRDWDLGQPVADESSSCSKPEEYSFPSSYCK